VFGVVLAWDGNVAYRVTFSRSSCVDEILAFGESVSVIRRAGRVDLAEPVDSVKSIQSKARAQWKRAISSTPDRDRLSDLPKARSDLAKPYDHTHFLTSSVTLPTSSSVPMMIAFRSPLTCLAAVTAWRTLSLSFPSLCSM
jgi:hypothetical protein